MIASVDAFRAGRIELRRLVVDLESLFRAADLYDRRLMDEWRNHAAPIEMELELRAEDSASEGAVSDESLDRALGDFRSWASRVLDSTDLERT
jgi:hypothetical protein